MSVEIVAGVTEAGGRLRVFLVDDHRLFLSGVRSELRDEALGAQGPGLWYLAR